MGKINKKLADRKVQLSKPSKVIVKSKEIKNPAKDIIKNESNNKKQSKQKKAVPEVSLKEFDGTLDKLAKNILKNLTATKSSSESDVIQQESVLDINLVQKGTDAVLQCISKQTKNADLFSECQPIFLQIICIKIPKCPRYILRIPIPNSLLTPTSDVCLFVGDLHKGRKTDHEPTIEHYEDLLREKGVKNIKTIIPMRQVKTEYDQFELRRRLASLYEFFLVDAKIAKHLNKKLGNIFLRQRKVPVPISFKKDDLKETITKALHKTSMYVHPDGDTYLLQVGHTKLKKKQILENVLAVTKALEKQFPGGFGNVRSLHLKGEQTPAIPIYVSLKSNSEVATPFIKPKRPKLFVPVEGELTTLNDIKVRVQPSGEVEILNGPSGIASKKEAPVKRLQPKKKQNKKEQKKKPLNNEGKITNGVEKNNKRKVTEESDSDDDALINTAEEEYLAQYSSELIENKSKKLKKKKIVAKK